MTRKILAIVFSAMLVAVSGSVLAGVAATNGWTSRSAIGSPVRVRYLTDSYGMALADASNRDPNSALYCAIDDPANSIRPHCAVNAVQHDFVAGLIDNPRNYFSTSTDSDYLDFASDFYMCMVYELDSGPGGRVIYQNGTYNTGSAVNNSGYRIGSENNYAYITVFTPNGNYSATTSLSPRLYYTNLLCWGRTSSTFWIKLNDGYPSTTIVPAYVAGTNAPARLGVGWQDGSTFYGSSGHRFAEIIAASSGLTLAQQDAIWTATSNCTTRGRCLPADANEVGYYSGDAYRTGGKWYADTAMTVSKALSITGYDYWYGAWTVPARYNFGVRARANFLTYSNLLANAAWTKDATVSVEDASADCPTLADGTAMSKVTSGTNANGVRQSVTGVYNPASRQAWMARPLSATADCVAAMSTATNPNSERVQKVLGASPKWLNYNNTTWSGALGIDMTRGTTGVLQRFYMDDGGATPQALANVGNYRYGLRYWDGTTMQVWDGTDPDAWIYQRAVTLPVRACTHRTIRDGNYLYVNGADRLIVFDVSTPSNPTVAGQVSISGSNEQCAGMTKVGNYIVSSGRKQYLQVIDVSTPTAPVLKGTAAGSNVCANGSSYMGCDGLDTYGGYVYVYHSDSTMNVYDVTSDPMVPALVASGVMPKGGGGSGKAVVVFDHYMAKLENDRMQVWDLTTPLVPTLAGQQTGLSFDWWTGNSVSATRGNYVYVSSVGLVRFDVSNPAAPVIDRDGGGNYWGGIAPITDDMVFASTFWQSGRRYFDLQLGESCSSFCVAKPMVESSPAANQFCGPTTSEPLYCPGGGKYFVDYTYGDLAVRESSVYAKGLGNRFAGVTGFASGDSYFSKAAGSELDHYYGTRCVLYTTGDDVTTDQHIVGNYDVNPGPFGAGFRISLESGTARCNGYGAGGLAPNTTYVTCCARHGSGVGYKTNDMTEWEVGTHPEMNTTHATTLGTGYAYSGDNQWHPFKGTIHEFADYPHAAMGQGGMQRALNKRVMQCSTPLPCFQRSESGAATNHCWASEQGVWTCGTGTAWTKIGTPQPAAPERRRFGSGDLSNAWIKKDAGINSLGFFSGSEFFYGESKYSAIDFKGGFTCHAVYSRDTASAVNGTIISDGVYGASGAGWALRSAAAGGVFLQTFTSGSAERSTTSSDEVAFGVNIVSAGRSSDGTTQYVKANGGTTASGAAYNTRDTLTTSMLGYDATFGTLTGKIYELYCTASAWSEVEVTKIQQDFLAMQGTGREPVSVTRTTDATAAALGRVTRVPAGVPRVTALGRLYESEKINLATYSEQFDQWSSVFNVTATTVSANSTHSADVGYRTADTLNVPSPTGSDYSARCIDFTATAAPYTAAIWVYGTALPHIYFWDGATTYYSTTCTSSSVYWYNSSCKVTATLTAAVWKLCIGHDRRDAAQSSTPSASFYAWGASITATDYVPQYCGPTLAAAKTCNADQITVSNRLNPLSRSWCVRVIDPKPENDRTWLTDRDRYWVDNAYLDGDDRIYLGTLSGTSSPRGVVTDQSSATLTADMGLIPPTDKAKLDARLCGNSADVKLYTDMQTATLLHFDGFGTTFKDSSAFNRTWTRNLSGTQESTAQKKFGTRSLLLDRNLDGWIKTAHTTDLEVPANPFTMDFWHYAVYDAGALGSGTEFYLMTQAAAGAYSPIAITQESGTNLVLRLSTDCASWTHTAAIGTTTKSAWHHIAIVRESPTGAFKTYLDGVAGATTGAGITLCNSAADFYLGGASGGTFSIGGYLDEFRFVKNVPLWTSAFTSPTLPAVGREWYGIQATGTGTGIFKKTGPTWQVGWQWDGTINGVELNQSGDYRDF